MAFALFTFSLIGNVSADSIGNFKQLEEMQITNYCRSADCSVATLSTIISPTGKVEYIDEEMDKVENDFSYNYTPTEIGTYIFKTCSNPRTMPICDSDTFEVTPSGFVGTLGFYLLVLILSLGIMILGFSIKDGWTVILGSFGFILLGLFILLNGIDGLKDTAYTYGIGIITIMVGAYIGIRSAMEQMDL